jgi:hypothetical protein
MFGDVHKVSRVAQVSRGSRNCRRSILEQFGLRYCAGGWRWGGGVITVQGGAQSSLRPDTVRDHRFDYECVRRADATWTTDGVCREQA